MCGEAALIANIKQWGARLCLVGLAGLAYANSFTGGLVFDNRRALLEDPRIRAVTGENLWQILTQEYWWPRLGQELYRPLTTLSFLFNYAVLGNGAEPLGYHLVNYALHCLNVLLVFAVVARLLRQDGMQFSSVAFVTAALFAVHPVNTEAVTNIVGRADLLAAAGVLGGLLCYLHSEGATGVGRRWWQAGLVGLTGLGLLSKESAVVLPAVLVLYELICRRERSLRWWVVLVPVGVWLLWRAAVSASWVELPFTRYHNALIAGDFWTARLTAVTILGRYLALMIWPGTLSADYSVNQIPLVEWGDWRMIAAVALVGAVLVGAWWGRQRSPVVCFFLLFFFVTLLPTSNLVILCGSTMGERFLYLPGIGILAVLSIVAGHWADGVRRRVRLLGISLVLLLTGATVRTWARNLDWRDELTFWRRLCETSPNNYRGYLGLGAYLETHGKPDLARVELERALQIAPALPEVLVAVGRCCRVVGDYDRAIELLTQSVMLEQERATDNAAYLLRHKPKLRLSTDLVLLSAGTELGDVYFLQQKPAEAITVLEWVRALDPSVAQTYTRLGKAYQSSGDIEQAAISFWQTRFLDSGDTIATGALFDIYQRGDNAGCAVLNGKFNTVCPQVKGHICAALAEMARNCAVAGQFELAESARGRAVNRYGCPPASIPPGE